VPDLPLIASIVIGILAISLIVVDQTVSTR
jgi:hypothetical protein